MSEKKPFDPRDIDMKTIKSPDPFLIDLKTIKSPTLKRLIEEMRSESMEITGYDRVHNRHNRGGSYSRVHSRHNRGG